MSSTSAQESTAEKIAARELQKKTEQEAKDREKCDKYVRNGLNRNVTVQFLLERLIQLGCPPPPGLIRCVDCGDKPAAGGFGVVEEVQTAPIVQRDGSDSTTPQKKGNCFQTQKEIDSLLSDHREGKVKLKLLPEIFLCQQHLRDETHAHEAMVHELIHAVDMCRTKMEPMTNCIHMACTEIRAENLSGECSWIRELGGGRMSSFAGHGAQCVKRRAALSVKANPNCSEKAEEYVEAAFERCYRDTFPFDRHPNLR
ncbi:hypothetical protein HJC23_003658 [Cyclotella cryptica]|uniref:Mitochondrial inner membrane protease ATP23 n=1 Tax=Cyclotella cryptica TaxID=29204 RepID=A0ABD3QJV6_9STRA